MVSFSSSMTVKPQFSGRLERAQIANYANQLGISDIVRNIEPDHTVERSSDSFTTTKQAIIHGFAAANPEMPAPIPVMPMPKNREDELALKERIRTASPEEIVIGLIKKKYAFPTSLKPQKPLLAPPYQVTFQHPNSTRRTLTYLTNDKATAESLLARIASGNTPSSSSAIPPRLSTDSDHSSRQAASFHDSRSLLLPNKDS